MIEQSCLHITLKIGCKREEKGRTIEFHFTYNNERWWDCPIILDNYARVGQIDLSLVSKAIAIMSPASIVSFISLCHFRRFSITHYRSPSASTSVFLYSLLCLDTARSFEKDVIPVLRDVLYRFICSAVKQTRSMQCDYLKFVAPDLHAGLSTRENGHRASCSGFIMKYYGVRSPEKLHHDVDGIWRTWGKKIKPPIKPQATDPFIHLWNTETGQVQSGRLADSLLYRHKITLADSSFLLPNDNPRRKLTQISERAYATHWKAYKLLEEAIKTTLHAI